MINDRRGRVLLLIALAILLSICLLLGVALGATDISLSSILHVIRDTLIGADGGVEQQVITDIRLPRVLLGFATGAGLAMCGLITQSLLRNPLGDPYILGISSGASTGAALVIVMGSSHAIRFARSNNRGISWSAPSHGLRGVPRQCRRPHHSRTNHFRGYGR